MKNQDNETEDIRYDHWETPVRNSWIYLLTTLHDSQYVHFFVAVRFNDGDEDKVERYELTIPAGDSYEITEENQGWKTNEYFFNSKGPKVADHQRCVTYKVWNTSYAKDTYCSGLMLAEHEKNPEHVFEYVIIGQDE